MAVRSTAVDLVSDFPRGDNGYQTQRIAELHRYVNENVSYIPDPTTNDYVAPPEETLDTGAGDCDCQAILVASLFEAIGETTRLVQCRSTNGERHVLPEVYLADSERAARNNIISSLQNYYRSRPVYPTTFSWDYDNGRYWFIADTAMGEYIGDRSLLANNGFIRETASGWEWNTVEFHYPGSDPTERNSGQHDSDSPEVPDLEIELTIKPSANIRTGQLKQRVEANITDYELVEFTQVSTDRFYGRAQFDAITRGNISETDLRTIPVVTDVDVSFAGDVF